MFGFKVLLDGEENLVEPLPYDTIDASHKYAGKMSVNINEAGKHSFASLEKYMLKQGDVTPNSSGRQELFENVVNRYIF